MISHSSSSSLPGLRRTRSGMPIADVVQRARVAQELGVGDAPADRAAEALAEEAHALDVLAGVAVARLGRLREAADDLELRLAQLLGALVDAALEQLAVDGDAAALADR